MADEKTPTVSSLPSGEPIPSPPKPSTSLLASAPAQADAFLSHLHRCLQTRAGTDITLLWLTYGSNLSADLLHLLAQPLSVLPASAASNPLFRAFLTLTGLLLRPGSLQSSLALQLASRLKALAGTLSEIRIFGRLWGLLGIYFGAKAAAEKRRNADPKIASSPEARFDNLLSYAQLTALVSYQALENISYLSSRKVIALPPQLQARLGKLSVRSWMVYIGLELGKLLVERSRRVPNRAYDAEAVREEKKWRKEWQKNFLRTLAWAPLTVNWSINQPVLPSLAVSALAFYPSMGMMRDLWRSKAEA